MKDVRHKATHEKRRYRTKRQKTNHGDGQDRRKWKHSRCREAQRFLGLKKWSECRLSVLQTRLDGFFVMWLTWPLHCPICLPGEAVGLLFAVRFGSLLIIINHYNQYSASSQQISFATLGWSWAETYPSINTSSINTGDLWPSAATHGHIITFLHHVWQIKL